MTSVDLIAGDFKIFELLDSDADGLVTREEWHAWLQKTHADKGEKGDKWLAALLHTLSTNVGLNTIKVAVDPVLTPDEETWDEEEDPAVLTSMSIEVNAMVDLEPGEEEEEDPHPMYDEAEEVFKLLAGERDVVSKLEFASHCHGDYTLFAQLDADDDGNLDIEEWHAFLQHTHEKKGKRGDEWLREIIRTLKQAIRNEKKAKREAKKPLIQNVGEHGVTIGNL